MNTGLPDTRWMSSCAVWRTFPTSLGIVNVSVVLFEGAFVDPGGVAPDGVPAGVGLSDDVFDPLDWQPAATVAANVAAASPVASFAITGRLPLPSPASMDCALTIP
jgi:hypothetical protein